MSTSHQPGQTQRQPVYPGRRQAPGHFQASPMSYDNATYGSQAGPQSAPPGHGAQTAPVARRAGYGNGTRVGYGLLWAGWTLVLLIGGLAALFGGQVLAGLIGLVLAALAGRYDYRIWTWQARRLLFLIVF
jgi:hypothetical protein